MWGPKIITWVISDFGGGISIIRAINRTYGVYKCSCVARGTIFVVSPPHSITPDFEALYMQDLGFTFQVLGPVSKKVSPLLDEGTMHY